MKNNFFFCALSVLTSSISLSQTDVKIKDGSSNTLLQINDEGTSGSLTLPPLTSIGSPNGKLYSIGTSLYWSGSPIGSGGVTSIDGLSDAKYDGSSLFMGADAGNSNSLGSFSMGVGVSSLYSNTSGSYNTGYGLQSLYFNTTGYNNSAIGYQALYGNITGYENNAIGHQALLSNTSGFRNLAIGFKALSSNTTANNNTAIGNQSLQTNTTGINNTTTGIFTLYSNTTGSYNTANGSQALYFNTTGNYNTGTGFQALYLNTTASNNTAYGYFALQSNSAGTDNTATGYWALKSNTSGYGNTANGSGALRLITSGQQNTASGAYSLYNSTTGSSNTATGLSALYSNTTGSSNTCMGYQALNYNTTGGGNVAVGSLALFYNIDGNYNTSIGYNSGPFLTGNFLNTTALGYGALITVSNSIVLGNTSVESIKGQVAFSTFSDGRYKTNVQENVNGLNFIMGLRPVTYNVDINAIAEKLGEDFTIDENGNRTKTEPSAEIAESRLRKANKLNTGFIAQEVETLAKSLGYDFSGVEVPQNEQSMYALRYAEFVVPLVKAVQEQQEQISDQQEMINKLIIEISNLK